MRWESEWTSSSEHESDRMQAKQAKSSATHFCYISCRAGVVAWRQRPEGRQRKRHRGPVLLPRSCREQRCGPVLARPEVHTLPRTW